jgi:hypothetical protein
MISVPITETPIRTGRAATLNIGAALTAVSGFGGVSDGSGSIRVPIAVSAAVVYP